MATASKIVLGVTESGASLEVNLHRLIESRLLVQANSGAGKSWTLRRLLEQSFGQVQHLVLDPEGEFASLRERYDYVLAGREGDTAADPRSAKMLAHRLLELGISAIVDIYELRAQDRVRFVRYFLEALVNAPKSLWHPVLVVVDEAHVYAPQKGEAESLAAVIDLATRGRKRGFCAVLATQRIAKLHKDAAAELNNKLIGRSSLDVDMRRAAEELGFSGRDDQQRLRGLRPGEFFGFGPAISEVVTRIKIGSVETTHPKVGTRYLVSPPPATEKVRRVLAKLADLPAEAEQETRDIGELRRRNAALQRELTLTRKGGGVEEGEVRRQVAEGTRSLRDKVATAEGEAREARRARDLWGGLISRAVGKIEEALGPLQAAVDGARRSSLPAGRQAGPKGTWEAARERAAAGGSEAAGGDGAPLEGEEELRSGARRILQELARRYPATYTKAQVGSLTGFTPSGGTFTTYVGMLRRRGLVEARGKELVITEKGLTVVGEIPPSPTTHEEVMQMWRGALRRGCFRILQAVVDAGEMGISKEELAETTEFTATGGTFTTYLGVLRRNGLVEMVGGMVRPAGILWPELVPA